MNIANLIKYLLNEDAGPKKSFDLINKIVNINSELSNLNIDAKLGIEISIQGDVQISFALKSNKFIEKVQSLPFKSNIDDRIGHLLNGIIGKIPYKEKKIIDDMLSRLYIPGGSIVIDKHESNCLDSWKVIETRDTTDGWGPLLYDVAMEWASIENTGLTSDRSTVSSRAYNVWDKYLNNRPDVTNTQLDIDSYSARIHKKKYPSITQLTPDEPEDDCLQDSAIAKDKYDWVSSPLSKVYEKPPVIINKLAQLKLLWKTAEEY